MASITWFLFSSRLRILLTATALLIGLYALAGFVIVPWLARPRMIEAIREMTGRETRLDTLKLNPFTLSGTMRGFEVTDLDGEKLLSFDRAYANFEALSYLFKGEFHLKEIDVANPFFRFQINQDGSINIIDLINRMTAKGTDLNPAGSHPLKVGRLRVADGSISITDLSRTAPFVSVIRPISFDITGFHTGGESDAPYSFSATSESGESFSWKGYVALNPIHSVGTFEVEGLSLPKYEPFYDILLSTDVTSGTIAMSASYAFHSGDGGIIQLQDAAIQIENLEVVDGRDKSLVAAVASASVTGATVDFLTRSIEVESIELKDGSVHTRRQKDGRIRLLTLVKDYESVSEPADPLPADSEATDNIPTPDFLIKSFSLEGFSIEMEDLAAPSPVFLALEDVTLKANDISSEKGASLSFSFGAASRTGGQIDAEGSLAYQPVAGSVTLGIQDLALLPADPYLSEFADLHLADGQISVSGVAEIDLSGEEPAGGFSGNASLTDFRMTGEDLGEDLATVRRMDLGNVEVALDPMSVAIGTINLIDPGANLIVSEDGSINLRRALRLEAEKDSKETKPMEPAEDTSAKPAPTGLALAFPVTIDRINLENVSAMVTDRSVSPAVTMGLETLSGTISGLSSEELARAEVDLHGTLTGGSEMTIKGTVNPLIEDRYTELDLVFDDFDLTTVSPYSARFAGYELSRGKLSFDLGYKISRAELEGENKVTIDQLTLGEKVESEDALHLPIALAVSLLRDPNGVIELDVPVRGNLNDPDFGYGKVVWGAIGNVITKLVTSPFKMLGGLVPGGAEVDISFLGFEPGGTRIDDEGIRKLDILARAMAERPSLVLEIHPEAGGPAESDLLRTRELDDNLRMIRWRELKDMGELSIPLEEVVLTRSDRDRLIERSYRMLFPNRTEVGKTPSTSETGPGAGTLTTDSPPNETSVVEPEKEKSGGVFGFFQRLFSGGSKETATSPEAIDSQAQTRTDQEIAGQPDQPTEAPALSVAQMEARLLKTIEVPQEDLRKLADARAESVRTILETTEEIAPRRLSIVRPTDGGTIDSATGQPRVTFSLE